MPEEQPEKLKLSKATLKKINKAMTGPLLGGIDAGPPMKARTTDLAARVAPLGSILAVRARMRSADEGFVSEL
jgi:hypothetical protein